MKHRIFVQLTIILTGLAFARPGLSGSDHGIEPATPPVSGTIDIGSTKQLLLDDLLIQQTNQISRFMGRPQKYAKNPVIVADQPWELAHQSDINMQGVHITGQNVIYDEEEKTFKMWYWVTSVHSTRPIQRRRPGYAVSRDGYHWEKPRLNLHEFNGSRDNNLISGQEWGSGGYHNIVKDSHDSNPQRRYKAIGWASGDGDYVNGKKGMTVAFSPDGLRWTEYEGNPVVPAGREISDSPTMLGWDSRIQKYVYYPRPGQPLAPVYPSGGGPYGRTIRVVGYSESDDFLKWTPTRTILAPDGHDRVDYQYYQFTTALHGEFYLGLLCMYETHEKTFDIFLLSSRDNLHWNWIDRQRPFLGRGEIGTYDAGYATPSGLIFHDNKAWIFYGAYSGAHSLETGGPLGPNHFTVALATLPMDRFSGLLAGLAQATILTRPLRFSGNKLLLDFDAGLPELSRKALLSLNRDPSKGADFAEVRAALEDPAGGKIAGFTLEQCKPLNGSGIQEMTWPGADWSQIAGKPVRIRLEMRNVALYSLQFSE